MRYLFDPVDYYFYPRASFLRLDLFPGGLFHLLYPYFYLCAAVSALIFSMFLGRHISIYVLYPGLGGWYILAWGASVAFVKGFIASYNARVLSYFCDIGWSLIIQYLVVGDIFLGALIFCLPHSNLLICISSFLMYG